jgi:cardiolipin synthase
MRLSTRLSGLVFLFGSIIVAACSSAPEGDAASSNAAMSAASKGHHKPPVVDAAPSVPAGPAIVSQFETPSSPATAGLQPVIDAINGAEATIEMEMFHLTVRAVADALVNAVHRGVTVRLIIDQDNWNSHTTAALKKDLTNGGVQVTPSSTGFRITHEKSFVVDGSTAYVMSLNLTSPFGVTRDYAVATTDIGVIQEFESVFDADLTNAQNGTANTPALSSPYLVWSPVNSEDRLVALVNSAKKTILATSENIDSGPVAAAMVSAAARGVSVRVIAPLCDQNANTAYDVPALTMLNQGGAEARAMPTPATAETPYMHGKMIVADDTQAYLGSVNLSAASMTDARELGILVSDPVTLQMLSASFESDWAQSVSTIPTAPSCPATTE